MTSDLQGELLTRSKPKSHNLLYFVSRTMPKRKRDHAEEIIDNIEDRAVRIKASRLKARIDQGNKSLKDALNLARGFERQKLGRRQKQASNEPHTLLRLREEVIVLKELDVARTAKDYLFKQLVRTKKIRESAAFIALYGDEAKAAPSKSLAEANVQGRLFKANPVKEILPGIMDGIRQVLNLEASAPATTQSQSQNGEQDLGRKEDTQSQSIEDGEFEGFSDDQVMAEDSVNGLHTEGENENEIDFDIFNDRLAGSSTDSEQERIADLDPMEVSDVERSDSESQSSISIDPSEIVLNTTQLQQQPKLKEKVSSTAFLPSLSMGGYYSGSESDDDGFDNRDRGPPLPEPRRNRRGQRARQKIAELKFGNSAKHLQKPQHGKDSRSTGWDTKRGAVDGNGYNPRQKRFSKGSSARPAGPTGSNGEPLAGDRTARKSNGASRKNEPALHPSWEAAKKKKQESSGATFAGTKVTFD